MNIKTLTTLIAENKKAARCEISLNEGLYLVYLNSVSIANDGTLTWTGHYVDVTSDEPQKWSPITHTETKFCGNIKDTITQAIDPVWYETVRQDIAEHGWEHRTKFCDFSPGVINMTGYLLINVYTNIKNGITYKNVNYSPTKCAQLLSEHETTAALLEEGIITTDMSTEEISEILLKIKNGNCNPVWAQHFVYIPHSASEGMQELYQTAFGKPKADAQRKEVK